MAYQTTRRIDRMMQAAVRRDDVVRTNLRPGRETSTRQKYDELWTFPRLILSPVAMARGAAILSHCPFLVIGGYRAMAKVAMEGI